MQHANVAVDEVRRAEFFRKGGAAREVVKGKRWLLLSRWVNLTTQKKRQLNALFALNRRVMKAYLLKVLVAVGEGANMAGPQGPLCHRLMAAETPPVLGGRRRLHLSRFDDGLGWPWLGIFKCENEPAGFRLV
jgi:hypothetical protein